MEGDARFSGVGCVFSPHPAICALCILPRGIKSPFVRRISALHRDACCTRHPCNRDKLPMRTRYSCHPATKFRHLRRLRFPSPDGASQLAHHFRTRNRTSRFASGQSLSTSRSDVFRRVKTVAALRDSTLRSASVLRPRSPAQSTSARFSCSLPDRHLRSQTRPIYRPARVPARRRA